jgi:hypothetical protein
MRVAIRLLLAATAALALPLHAAAGAPEPRPEPGAYCTKPGCSGPAGARWDGAAGFAAAAVGAGWLARRRPARRP